MDALRVWFFFVGFLLLVSLVIEIDFLLVMLLVIEIDIAMKFILSSLSVVQMRGLNFDALLPQSEGVGQACPIRLLYQLSLVTILSAFNFSQVPGPKTYGNSNLSRVSLKFRAHRVINDLNAIICEATSI
jgi:hypothetical protein